MVHVNRMKIGQDGSPMVQYDKVDSSVAVQHVVPLLRRHKYSHILSYLTCLLLSLRTERTADEVEQEGNIQQEMRST